MPLLRKASSVIQTTKLFICQVEVSYIPGNQGTSTKEPLLFDARSRIWSKNIFYTVALFPDSLLENLKLQIWKYEFVIPQSITCSTRVIKIVSQIMLVYPL